MKLLRSPQWLTLSLIAAALFPFLAATSQGQATSGQIDTVERSPSQLVCTMSLFLSFNDSDVIGGKVHIDGRGLASCKSDQGFATEAPIFADVDAKLTGPVNAGETAFSANTSTFVIPREIGQIADIYDTRNFSWTDGNKPEPTIVFRGRRHDLVIETKLSSATAQIAQLQIESMRLRFDDTAPDFE